MKNLLFEYKTTIPESWIDSNGHMNDAQYNRAFSDAEVPWFEHLGLGEEQRQKLNYTVFTLETHVVYQKEVFAHEEITIRIKIHDYDAKRIHAFMTLHDPNGDQCATFEVMYMGIDRETGRPAPFPEKIAEAVKSYYDGQDNDVELKELGSKIGIRR